MASPRPRAALSSILIAAGTCAFVLTALWPRATYAEQIPDYERAGEYDESGMRFGNVVVKGELVADKNVPGGWALVRTLENKGDQPERCVVEERLLRVETMPSSRVDPPPTALILRNQTITLDPHQKRKVGVALPEAIGVQITAQTNRRAWLEREHARMIETGKYDLVALRRTYMSYFVEYLKPLPPGATAAPPPDNGITRPMAYSEANVF